MKVKKMPTSELQMELAKHFVNPMLANIDRRRLTKELAKRLRTEPDIGGPTTDPVERELAVIIVKGLADEYGYEVRQDDE